MNTNFGILKAVILTAAVLLCWHLFSGSESGWLRVETKYPAVSGSEFTVRVTFLKPVTSKYIGIDLHGMDHRKNSIGFLSYTEHQITDSSRTVYEFSLPVPSKKNPAYVFPVIVLSETGSWQSREHVAYADAVPVCYSSCNIKKGGLISRSTTDLDNRHTDTTPDSIYLTVIIVFAWIAVSMLMFQLKNNTNSFLIAFVAILSSAAEIVCYILSIDNPLRRVIHEAGLYNFRRAPQQLFSIVVIICSALFFIYIISSFRRPYKNILLLFIIFFMSVAVLQILSLHELDSILSVKLAGLHSGQLLRSLSALCSLILSITFYKRFRIRT